MSDKPGCNACVVADMPIKPGTPGWCQKLSGDGRYQYSVFEVSRPIILIGSLSRADAKGGVSQAGEHTELQAAQDRVHRCVSQNLAPGYRFSTSLAYLYHDNVFLEHRDAPQTGVRPRSMIPAADAQPPLSICIPHLPIYMPNR